MDTHIREAIEEDLPKITDIYNWAIKNTTASFDINPQTIEQRAVWFSHYGGDRFPLIVYIEDGEVAGYASLSEFRTKEGYKNTCELSVYVQPDFQKQGIGKKLMDYIIQLGRDVGYHNIISCITTDNIISIQMHEKKGFKLCGELKEVGYKFGRYLDCLFYQLLL
ncbi:GNAT family N-acetyltransferase [Ruminiclostridium cellulolyticum]|uniref:GCN5-related N-acetyltransferase n=1 Tax=Ruminiclostridium cellulolyticum (strain ATCC 35319 / DSM 5812 / JCM 6584 / H10) TaxID=394503 RepID=B8I3T7_RUMCH|nr:GNAT family N-acetyltransferase [Ruminiclostridium cellulolyticum]ACL74414.1 GCN5-related N-acetyltransferase [Ruminiclostridium cellulolyticum H10]